MTWIYNQANGILAHNCAQVGVGYSGHPPHVNDTAAESIRGQGPLPRGFWTYGEAIDHPKLGKCAIPITPKCGTETFGRSGFWCHGDEIAHAGEELASDGCQVMGLSVRLLINSDLDKDLEVV